MLNSIQRYRIRHLLKCLQLLVDSHEYQATTQISFRIVPAKTVVLAIKSTKKVTRVILTDLWTIGLDSGPEMAFN